jgi:integrase/recombinase XerD
LKAPVVRLKIRVRLPDGSRPFLDPVFSGNGKLKPLYAVVDGTPEHHPEGSSFLRYAAPDGKRVWDPVGNDPQLALVEKQKREKVLGAQAVGVEVVDDAPAPDRTILSEPIEEYLGEVKDAKAKKTLLACTLALNLFAGAVKRESLEEIDRKDVLAFIRAMREEKLSPRTIAERILRFAK